MYGIPRLIPILLLVCFAGARPLLNAKNAAPDYAPESHSFSRRDNPLTNVVCPLLAALPSGTSPLAAAESLIASGSPGLPGTTTVGDLLAAFVECNQSGASPGGQDLGRERDPTQNSGTPVPPGGDNSGTPGTFQRFASAPAPPGGSPDNNGTGNPPNGGSPVNSQSAPAPAPNAPAPAPNVPVANNGNSGSNSNGSSPGTNPANDARAATANTSQNQSNVSAATNPNGQSNQPPSSPAAGTSGNSAPSPNVNQPSSAPGGGGFHPYGSSGDNTTNDANNANSNSPNPQAAQRDSSSVNGDSLLGIAPASTGAFPIPGGIANTLLAAIPGNPLVGSSSCGGGLASACTNGRTGS